LDLVPILAAITDPAASQAMAEPTALDEQIDFAPLRRLDLDLQLDLQELIMSPQLRLTEVTTRAQLREGQLSVSPLQAVLFGGRFAGTMRVDFREDIPQVILEPTLSAIDVARVLRLATPLAPLTGQGDLRLRLKFSGLTLNEVLSSLDGSGEYSLTDGTLVGLDLRALLEQDLSQPSFRQITRSLGGETPFRALSGQVSVNAGVVALPDLALLASDYGMAGQGQIDLAANALNYRLTVQLGERLTAQLPRTLRELTGGSIPLQLAGPISQPQVTIDLGNVVERSLRRELEDRLLRPRQPDASDDVSETDPEAEAPRERGRDRLLRELRELLRDGPPNQ
jgi:AsmA protein